MKGRKRQFAFFDEDGKRVGTADQGIEMFSIPTVVIRGRGSKENKNQPIVAKRLRKEELPKEPNGVIIKNKETQNAPRS